MSETTKPKDTKAAVGKNNGVVIPPEGATHYDNGPSNAAWIRVLPNTHDYWCEVEQRWVTFEAGSSINRYNVVRDHWEIVA